MFEKKLNILVEKKKKEKNGKNKQMNNCLPTYSNQTIHTFF